MVFFVCCLQGERRGSFFVDLTGRSPMSSDWVREHEETNATKGGAPMAWCLCCLYGERKRYRFVNVTGRFPMSSDWVR
jgi:hypothetical protein